MISLEDVLPGYNLSFWTLINLLVSLVFDADDYLSIGTVYRPFCMYWPLTFHFSTMAMNNQEVSWHILAFLQLVTG